MFVHDEVETNIVSRFDDFVGYGLLHQIFSEFNEKNFPSNQKLLW